MADYAYTIAEAWRMLCGYRDALAAGGETPSSVGMGRRLGFSESKSIILRRACVQLGWMVIVTPPKGAWPGELALTAAGRVVAKLCEPPSEPAGMLHIDRNDPPRPQQRRQPQPAPAAGAPTTGAGKEARRRCLCCGQPFDSAGPHNRICPRCRGTEEFRSTPPTFSLRL
jgi:hypothetical protein